MVCSTINPRNAWALLLLLACCWTSPSSLLIGAQAAGLSLDRGGFSVDFSNAGTVRTTGENLLRNGGMEDVDANGRPTGWLPDSYVWFPTEQAAARATSIHERVKPLMRWESSADRSHGGIRAACLAIPRVAHREDDPPGHEYCAFWNQSVTLPELTGPRKYVLTCYHRSDCDPNIPDSQPYVRVTFFDNATPGQGGQTRVYAQALLAPDAAWRQQQLEFIAPKGTRRLDVRLALRGCGKAWFDDVSLESALVQEHGLSVRLMPGSYLDNLYCLATGDAGVMNFGFRNETGAKVERPVLVVQLPEFVEVLDLDASATIVSRKSAQIEGASLLECRFDISAWRNRIHEGDFPYPYNQWDGLMLLLRTSLPADDARYKAWYWLEDGAYRSEPLSFDLKVVPPIPSVAGPRTFKSGAHLFLVHNFRSEEGVRTFAALYKQVGFNAVHVPPSPLGTEFGRLGIERYTQPFANGYSFGSGAPNNKSEEAVFRLVDGQPRWEAVCPVEVYRRGPWFREHVENDLIRKPLVTDRSAEQIMANWEPYMYIGKGCFCNRCKEEFQTFSKLPAAEVARVWPKDVIREHGATWVKFRSWQHGRLMATLEETVHAVGKEAGLDSHFIPEIHYGLLTAFWAKHAGNEEYAAVDYLDKLPAMEPWAPYNWYRFGVGPYDYVRGLHLSSHVTARQVLEFLDERLGPAKRPRLFAFPFGTYEGATQPEALSFEFLTYWLNGYNGAFAYLFPGGYDARYWRAGGDEPPDRVARTLCRWGAMREQAHPRVPDFDAPA